MDQIVQLNDPDHAERIGREIGFLRDSGALGRSPKLRDLFDYLVDRSQSGTPPREIEISQDVFGRTADARDDGAGRVYIHRLRRRLEEIYTERTEAGLRIVFPLGEYRLAAELRPEVPEVEPIADPAPARHRPAWRSILIGAVAGMALAAAFAAALLHWPSAEERQAARVRETAIWAPLFANGRSIVVAEGDHYLFAERGANGETVRLVRDYRIHNREELDAWLLAHPQEASRYADIGGGYIPPTVPRGQLYLSRILLGSPSVRTLPASQISASAMLSQNIVYLGLTTGLGPLRPPVAAGSRFELGRDADVIRDRRTGQVYDGGRSGTDAAPRRQYALLSLFTGKEGNRYMVLAGTSDMALVGLVETLADSGRLEELAAATQGAAATEALYQVDSQGAGVLAVQLIATNRRDERTIWAP